MFVYVTGAGNGAGVVSGAGVGVGVGVSTGGTSEYVRNELRAVVGARSARPDLQPQMQQPDLDPLMTFDMSSSGKHRFLFLIYIIILNTGSCVEDSAPAPAHQYNHRILNIWM